VDHAHASGRAAISPHAAPNLLARLERQRRVFDRLDWWLASAWAASDAWVAGEDAALLAPPLDLGPHDALSAARHPVAWVRWCAVLDGVSATPLLAQLFARARARLAEAGVRELGCLARNSDWLEAYLRDLGFAAADRVLTFALRPGRAAWPKGNALIRAAELADLDAIEALDADAFAAPWRYPAAIMRRALELADVFTVAEDDGRIVGYQCASLGSECGHVVRLAVHTGARRRGVGRALLSDAIVRLTARGASCVTLNTPESNDSAQALYGQLGFRPAPERPRAFRKRLADFDVEVTA
jgi:ribosomal protein S18 acetylase RimI-like enzyme